MRSRLGTILVALVLLATTSGCAGTRAFLAQTPEVKILKACVVYAEVLTTLADMRRAGQLADEQIATVDAAIPGINRICMADPPMNNLSVYHEVQAALVQILIIRGPEGGTP